MAKFESGALAGWDSVLDELIVGVSHHISNRVSTLAGVSDILSREQGIPPILRALADEVPKLEEAIRLLRLLAAPDEPEEAVEPLRLVTDAIAMARLHPALRGVCYTVEAGNIPPVLAKPGELTHRIILLLVHAGVGLAEGEIVVRVRVVGTDVVIQAGEGTVCARTLMAARAG